MVDSCRGLAKVLRVLNFSFDDGTLVVAKDGIKLHAADLAEMGLDVDYTVWPNNDVSITVMALNADVSANKVIGHEWAFRKGVCE